MKKVLSLILVTVLISICGCSLEKQTESFSFSDAAKDKKEKNITLKIIQYKVEVADVFRKMEADFEKENPGIKLSFETFGGGVDYEAALMAKFQSGENPDIFVNEGYEKINPWIERVEDLSDQPWVKDLIDGSTEAVRRDGKLLGMPINIEGYGFAYNKALFDKAGITTIPNTLTSLENACKKLKAAGIQPFSNAYGEWWVLGMHNFNVPLAHQSNARKFIADIASRKMKFADNPTAAGWIRLLDLTLKYGQKDPAATGDYTSAVAVFAAGKAAMIQQGNWIQPDLDKVDENLDVGFMPIPLSDIPDDKICAGTPNYWIVNSDSAVKEDAKAWLNWLVSSETGKRYLIEELKFIPAFKSIQTDKMKGLNTALLEFVSDGRTYGWEFPKLPGAAAIRIGNSMMKYLSGQMTAEELNNDVDNAIIENSDGVVN